MSQKQKIEKPRYLLTEAFYDNLVLWEKDEEIEWEGIPAASMVPLNDAADEKMMALRKEMAKPYRPPLSELADTMDGRVTSEDFAAGDRKNRAARGKAGKAPPFPKRPGAPDNQPQYRAKRIPVSQSTRRDDDIDDDSPEFIGAPVGDPHGKLEGVPQKPVKNFDRVAK